MKRIAFAALALGMAATAEAQTPAVSGNTTGFMLNAHVLAAPGITLKGENGGSQDVSGFGGGVGLQVGYGFTPMFMAFANMDLAKQGSEFNGLDGSFGLTHFEVGLRSNFHMQSRYIPYATVAFGARAIGAEVESQGQTADVSISGSAFSVGAGLQRFWSRKLALDLGVQLGFGKFDTQKIDDNETDLEVKNTMTTRLKLGVNWYPGAK